MEQNNCLKCNKIFKAYKYMSQKFCSQGCYHSYMRGKPLVGERLKKQKKSAQIAIDSRKNNLEIREKWIKKMKEVTLGENNPNWVNDRSQIVDGSERSGSFYQIWRRGVLRRDKHLCKINNKDCDKKLEVHHILSWKSHPELRFNINNGITLCHAHHPRMRSEEKRLSPYFMDLVSVSK